MGANTLGNLTIVFKIKAFKALAFAVIGCTALASGQAWADPLQLGEAVYARGETASNQATIGNEHRPAPASLFPCANCHGADGRGSTEAGFTAPSIRWQDLDYRYRTQPGADLATTPHYTKAHLQAALSHGRNSAGAPLATLMPRYTLSEAEWNGLILYLTQLEQQAEPGITEQGIKIAIVLPQDPLQSQVSKALLSQDFRFKNHLGGRYQRQYQLDFITRQDALNPGRQDKDDAYFLVLNLNPSAEAPPKVLSPKALQLALFGALAGKDTGLGSQTYALYATPASFGNIALQFAAQTITPAANQPCRNTPGDSETLRTLAPFTQSQQTSRDSESCLPTLFVTQPQPQLPGDAVKRYPAPIYALVPPTPQQANERGQQHYLALREFMRANPSADSPDLLAQELTLQLWLLTLSDLVDNLIADSGRQLNQANLHRQLVQQYHFRNPYGPPLTFVANRRIGAYGATLVPLNPAAQQAQASRAQVSGPVWFEANND